MQSPSDEVAFIQDLVAAAKARRPRWWIDAQDRDARADERDRRATHRDAQAALHDTEADEREKESVYQSEAASVMVLAAHARLDRAESEGVSALIEVGKMRSLGQSPDRLLTVTEVQPHETAAAHAIDQHLENLFSALISMDLERQAARADIEEVVQHQAGAAADRIAARIDRAAGAADRSLAAADRSAARIDRQIAAATRAPRSADDRS